jgi:hypothetical protein
MTGWEVVRIDESGSRSRVSTYGSRVTALAAALSLRCAGTHADRFLVEGPTDPGYTTNRDLYLHALAVGRDARQGRWSLSAYLRALWRVGSVLRNRQTLDLDEVAAMYSAALVTTPPPFDSAWPTADLALFAPEPSGFDDWERILLSQIADLEDFAADPPGVQARFGASAPRPPDAGRRATPTRWLNFDPETYLECATAGHFGGWDAADGARVPLPAAGGLTLTKSTVHPITTVGWTDLAHLALCGQLYE